MTYALAFFLGAFVGAIPGAVGLTIVHRSTRRHLAAMERYVEESRLAREGETPDDLRARADRVESRRCPGISARWCPVHGGCDCREEVDLNDDLCPLHAPASSHGAWEFSVPPPPPRPTPPSREQHGARP